MVNDVRILKICCLFFIIQLVVILFYLVYRYTVKKRSKRANKRIKKYLLNLTKLITDRFRRS